MKIVHLGRYRFLILLSYFFLLCHTDICVAANEPDRAAAVARNDKGRAFTGADVVLVLRYQSGFSDFEGHLFSAKSAADFIESIVSKSRANRCVVMIRFDDSSAFWSQDFLVFSYHSLGLIFNGKCSLRFEKYP